MNAKQEEDAFSFIEVDSDFGVRSINETASISMGGTECGSCLDEESKFDFESDSKMEPKNILDLSYEYQDARCTSRRKRLEDSGRLGRMNGLTCWKFQQNKKKEVVVTRPFPNAVSDIDIALQVGSDLKLESSINMDKSSHWLVPDLLQRHAVSVKSRRSDKSTMVFEYEVPVVGLLKESRKRQAISPFGMMNASTTRSSQEEMNENRIFQCLGSDRFSQLSFVSNGHEKLLENDPEITEFKKIKIRAPRGSERSEGVRRAFCRNGCDQSWFSPNVKSPKYTNQYLEIDLKDRKLVKAISTSGKQIFTSMKKDKEGRLYQCVPDDFDATRERFFPAFDLWYKVDQSSPLIYLGRFSGPADNFEEKVVSLSSISTANRPSGVFCRFLRIKPVIPVEYSDRRVMTSHTRDMTSHSRHMTSHASFFQNWAAGRGMRVAVFGHPNIESNNDGTSESKMNRQSSRNETIIYRLETPRGNDHAIPRKGNRQDRLFYYEKSRTGRAPRRSLRQTCRKQSFYD